MIISASRRTDIPAFYTEWFMNRLRVGYCTVPNPFNLSQVRRVSLLPEDVDMIVFWTRNPRPLFPYLKELDVRGYRYYFQFTLLDNPRLIDPKTPPAEAALHTFRDLSEQTDPRRVIWRYDPLVLSQITPPDFHLETFERLARSLSGYTQRTVISLVDEYPKARKRLEALQQSGASLLPSSNLPALDFTHLMSSLAGIAAGNGMEIMSCAEEIDLQPYGIRPGKCVDDGYIQEVFGLDVTHQKDPGQRKACGCVVSRDIGMYDSCLFGCKYCYATSDFERSKINYDAHNPESPSLLGWYEA